MPEPTRVSRRELIAGLAAWTTLPALFRGDPYRPLVSPPTRPSAIRVRGRVTAAGKGLGRVAVTDGRIVVPTGADGSFELVTDSSRRYVTVSTPAGHRFPVHPSGTIRQFERLAPDGAGEMRVRFDLTSLPESDERHAFLVLADVQTQDADDMATYRRESVPAIKRAVTTLGERAGFAVADGDIMWDELALYDQYEAAVAEIAIPFVQVVGNHDLDKGARSRAGSIVTFERRFGPRYHSFNRGRVHYVVLDDVFYYDGGYLGYVDDDQLTWLANDLALIEPGAPVVVFAHIPFTTTITRRRGGGDPPPATAVTNREAIYQLLSRYRTTILTGHLHESDYATAGGVWERHLGAVCGGWWTGDICYDGTPAGFAIYEAEGAELKWRYQSTGHEPNHQMRVYRAGSDPRAPNEIVANVWSYEPGWTVVWYENGERRGAMARRVGLDPLSVTRMAGDRLPPKRPWVDPTPTRHLFYAPVSPDAREIRVEATDQWGRSYSEIVR